VRLLKHPWLRVGSLCAMALMYAVWTYERNGVWASPVTLWRDSVAKSPYKARPHWNLAAALQRQGPTEEEAQQYRAIINYHLGDVWGRQDKGGEVTAHFLLAETLQRLGKIEEAVHHYTAVIAVLRTDKRVAPLALASRRRMYMLMTQEDGVESNVPEGTLEAAVYFFTEVLRLMPNSVTDHNALGRVLERQGKMEEAIHQYTEALRLDPHYPQAHKNLERAQRHLEAATGLAHPNPQP